MKRRVETAAEVNEVEINLADGTTYTFALDMRALAYIEDEHGDAMAYLEDLMARIRTRPIATMSEFLYVGIRSRHPDVTLEDIMRKIPPSAELLQAVVKAASAGLPGDDAMRPTHPTRQQRQQRRRPR